ncbi:uncharacterized protein LOC134241549 isoform X1 [Saccostrea cucullata]|uniref:uncharacterized protein LOC134241549 isoform X1 n=1 Tax=Saccostrea cuccullata TaxID=36930 RepID=UPI002ED1C0AD
MDVNFRPVTACPKDGLTWLNNGIKLQCPNDTLGRNLYQCVPNDGRSSLVEFCLQGSIGRYGENTCPFALSSGHLDAINCSTFLKGCPKEPYLTNEVYKYPACLEINPQKRCYLANENCLNKTSQEDSESTTLIQPTDSSSYILSTESFNLTSVLPNSTSNLQPGIETVPIIAGVVSLLIVLLVIFVIFFLFYSRRCCRSWNTMNSTEMNVIPVQEEEKDKEKDLELLLDFVSRQLSFADLAIVSTYLGEPQLAETTYLDRTPSETYCKLFHVWRCKYTRIDHKAKLKEVFSSMERQDLIERMEMFSKDSYFYKEVLVNPTEQAQSSDFIIMSKHLASRSQHVLHFLGLKQTGIDQIERDNRTTQEKILRALSKIQKDRSSLTRQSICNALYYADHSDVIDILNSSWNRADVVANIKPTERDKCIAEIHVKPEPKKNIPDVNETDINTEIEKRKPAVQNTDVKSKPEYGLGNEEEGEAVRSDTDEDGSSDSEDIGELIKQTVQVFFFS